ETATCRTGCAEGRCQTFVPTRLFSVPHFVHSNTWPRRTPTDGYIQQDVKELGMHKRRLIAIAIALMLTLVTTAMWSASTIVREGDPDANFLEDSGSTVGAEDSSVTEKKKGNKV